MMAWFHGRGIDKEMRPLIRVHQGGAWGYDFIILWAGKNGANRKVGFEMRDHDRAQSAGFSDELFEIDRWTHLAASFDFDASMYILHITEWGKIICTFPFEPYSDERGRIVLCNLITGIFCRDCDIVH